MNLKWYRRMEIINFSITAYYDTDTVFGMLYWYMFLPLHNFIFNDLIKQIEKRSMPLHGEEQDG